MQTQIVCHTVTQTHTDTQLSSELTCAGKGNLPLCCSFFFFFFRSQSYLSATGVFVDLKVEKEGEPNKNHTLIEGNIRLALAQSLTTVVDVPSVSPFEKYPGEEKAPV